MRISFSARSTSLWLLSLFPVLNALIFYSLVGHAYLIVGGRPRYGFDDPGYLSSSWAWLAHLGAAWTSLVFLLPAGVILLTWLGYDLYQKKLTWKKATLLVAVYLLSYLLMRMLFNMDEGSFMKWFLD